MNKSSMPSLPNTPYSIADYSVHVIDPWVRQLFEGTMNDIAKWTVSQGRRWPPTSSYDIHIIDSVSLGGVIPRHWSWPGSGGLGDRKDRFGDPQKTLFMEAAPWPTSRFSLVIGIQTYGSDGDAVTSGKSSLLECAFHRGWACGFSAVSSVTNAPDTRSLLSELLGIVSISNVPTHWCVPEALAIS